MDTTADTHGCSTPAATAHSIVAPRSLVALVALVALPALLSGPHTPGRTLLDTTCTFERA